MNKPSGSRAGLGTKGESQLLSTGSGVVMAMWPQTRALTRDLNPAPVHKDSCPGVKRYNPCLIALDQKSCLLKLPETVFIAHLT